MPTALRLCSGDSLCALARERLAQNPSNSSRPPSTRAPWEQAEERAPEDPPVASAQGEVKPQTEAEPTCEERPQQTPQRKGAGKPAGRPGRRKGAPGHSRTQQLPVDAEEVHAPHGCAICGRILDASHEHRAHNARYELELVPPR